MSSGNGFGNKEAGNGSAQSSLKPAMDAARGLDQLTVPRTFLRGSVLFGEGEPPHGIYIIRKGKVKVAITSSDGSTLILRIAEPGELLGINATLTGQPYMATVQALERCQIDFIAREDLLILLSRDPQMYPALAQCLSRKLTGLVNHTRLLLLSQSAAAKLAGLLLKWAEECGEPTPQGVQIQSELTHEEIGQMIRTSRETVTRLLNTLKRKQILAVDNGRVLIRDLVALSAFKSP